MKRSPINKISDKQNVEIKKRQELKAGLIAEYGEHCMTCNDKNRDWRGISLSHIVPLSRGGETSRKNCLLECYPDHDKYEKHPELRKKEENFYNASKSASQVSPVVVLCRKDGVMH